MPKYWCQRCDCYMNPLPNVALGQLICIGCRNELMDAEPVGVEERKTETVYTGPEVGDSYQACAQCREPVEDCVCEAAESDSLERAEVYEEEIRTLRQQRDILAKNVADLSAAHEQLNVKAERLQTDLLVAERDRQELAEWRAREIREMCRTAICLLSAGYLDNGSLRDGVDWLARDMDEWRKKALNEGGDVEGRT